MSDQISLDAKARHAWLDWFEYSENNPYAMNAATGDYECFFCGDQFGHGEKCPYKTMCEEFALECK